jgi:hypothetical protein
MDEENALPTAPTAGTARRPYAPPAVASSEAYERLALACTGSTTGRGGPTPPVACPIGGAPGKTIRGCDACNSS